ncbi:MAG: hypothetical protein ACP5PS_08445 [Bacteroidales bacterium]
MKKLDIILKGGLKSCCSTYSAADMKRYTKSWFDNLTDVEYNVIDIDYDEYDTGPLADLAYKYFGNQIFPLVYLNGQLMSIGMFPNQDECLQIIENPTVITKEDIEEAAKRYNELKNRNYEK